MNGVPSCANTFLLQTVLREAWNFTGYVTSDSGAVQDIYDQHHYLNATAAEGVAAAVKAGCDIDSSLSHGHSSSGSPYTWSLADALEQKLIDSADVDALLHRSLRLRFELGLFDPIADQPYWHYAVEEAVDTAASQQLNALATRSGLVLLKNDAVAGADDQAPPALPLTPRKGRVAVIGPHANAQKALVGNYLGQICPDAQGSFDCVETPAAAIARVNGGADSVIVSEGCTVAGASKSGFDDAVKAAKAAEQAVVLVLGLDTSNVEKEGHDRTSLGLPGVQLELVQAVVGAVAGQKPVVVVLLNGGAVALDWCAKPGNTDAILEASERASAGASASASAREQCEAGVSEQGEQEAARETGKQREREREREETERAPPFPPSCADLLSGKDWRRRDRGRPLWHFQPGRQAAVHGDALVVRDGGRFPQHVHERRSRAHLQILHRRAALVFWLRSQFFALHARTARLAWRQRRGGGCR